MNARVFSSLLAGVLVASVFIAVPARAAVTIPETVQIDDPQGDANGVNDQDNAYGTPASGQGDHTGASVGNATDILKVWFSESGSEISLNIQTNGNAGNLTYDTYFRFSSNPGQGPVAADTTRGCLQWVASINGQQGAYTGATEGTLTDKCNVGTAVAGPLVVEAGPGTTFVTTITFPKDYSPLLASGSALTTPFGVSRILYVGPQPQTAAFVTLDNTKRGTDYTVGSGGGAPAPAPGPDPAPSPDPAPDPGDDEPKNEEPKKKDCSKKKGKAKKKCKKQNKGGGGSEDPAPPEPPVGKGCPAYEPGDEGAEAETAIVTSDHTAEAPLEIPVSMDPGFGLISGTIAGIQNPFVPHHFHNIQVDSDGEATGLHVKFSFLHGEDYDIYLNFADGTEAAKAGGFNQAPHPVIGDGTGSGGHSEEEAEVLDGILTPDCGGYTLDVANALGTGEATMTMWLGDATWDPVAQAEIAP